MKHLRIALLRGGPSTEYDVSMQSGKNVLQALTELGFEVKDIVITRKGEWLDRGIVRMPKQALEAVDLVFNALHGTYGEDGGVQRLLQNLHIPFTGSAALTSSLAFNKVLTKQALNGLSLKTPKHFTVSSQDVSRLDLIVSELNETLGEELFLKPISGGSSVGAAYTTKATLHSVLSELLSNYDEILVEEYIRGREATVGVLEDFRNERLYALPVIEIIPPHDDPIFSYENKYNGRTTEICPGRFSYREKAELENIAKQIHSTLQCRHYSRSDFILRDGEVYFLEVNTLPGLTDESLFPKSADAIGLKYSHLIEHLIRVAIN